MKSNKPFFNKTSLFTPGVVKKIAFNTAISTDKYTAVLTGTTIGTSSFLYDQPGMTGIKSTQQLNVDFSKFENHTFFNSAESKVNVAFDRVINNFPFDGNTTEISDFFNSLTGYEKYVYDEFPKYNGFFHSSGSSHPSPTEGSYIVVQDNAGVFAPTLSKNKTGDSVLGSGKGSMTVEFTVQINPAANSPQVIVQRQSGSNVGFTIGLEKSSNPADCNLVAMLSSGSNNVIKGSMKLTKGGFHHVAVTFNRQPGINRIELYQSGNLVATSSNTMAMGDLQYQASPITIASGTTSLSGSTKFAGLYFEPTQVFSGAIDELRVFDGIRSPQVQKEFRLKNIFSTPALRLYYKFNEVTGSYPNNSVVLDSSGNGLHSYIKNYKQGCRELGGLVLPLRLEDRSLNPVLFPQSSDVIALNIDLLSSASDYDINNPNLITKLMPEHYLVEAQWDQNLPTFDGGIGDGFSSGSVDFPGGGSMPSPQIMSVMAFMWAKYFDEIKMYVDHFGELVHPDYDQQKGVANHFLPMLGELYGFSLPTFYSNASIKQMLQGKDLTIKEKVPHHSLMYVQGQIWRRILVNMHEIISSKGTIHGIKALIRATGLDPDSNFRFREFGGPRTFDIHGSRKSRTEVSTMISFSGSVSGAMALKKDPYGAGAPDPNTGQSSDYPFFKSAFLSGSRYEPNKGFPASKATSFTPLPASSIWLDARPFGVSPQPDDGLFTSGSWTYEGLYKFPHLTGNLEHFATQSLARFHVTGTTNTSSQVIFNLLAYTSSLHPPTTASLKLLGFVDDSGGSPGSVRPFELVLTGVNIFDGKKWHVSFGRKRNEEVNSFLSSSYFLRAGRQNFGDITNFYMTSSFVSGSSAGSNVLSNRSAANTSGSYICIGSQSLDRAAATSYSQFLNYRWVKPSLDNSAGWTKFSGDVTRIRFWSKALDKIETMEHVRNFKSAGVRDPFRNYNFDITTTGSWQKLRLDVTTDQPITQSNESGNMNLTDFSQTSGKAGAFFSGAPPTSKAIRPERFDYSIIDPKFDERSTDNKIRILSFNQQENIDELGGITAPVYTPPPAAVPEDDARFSIENSLVQALDEDIITLFGTLEEFNNILGDPELLFSDSYPDLRVLRDIYFNRLTRRIKIKEFFDFFKWFDDSIALIIERLIPSKTNFLGVNFVIESHMLERAKFRYNWQDSYVPYPLRLVELVPRPEGNGGTHNVHSLAMGMPKVPVVQFSNTGGGENNEAPQWGITSTPGGHPDPDTNKLATSYNETSREIVAVVKR